jgi:hypothetical protein
VPAANLDPFDVRAHSVISLESLGFPGLPAHYPVLFEPEENIRLRTAEEIRARAAALNVVVNRAMRMPPKLAVSWAETNALLESFTGAEWEFVSQPGGDRRFAPRIEALWALSWSLGIGEHLDPARYCGETLAASLPDLKRNEPYVDWVKRTAVREPVVDQMVQALDLYFCLHWGVADAKLRHQRTPGVVEGYVIEQRRWALEWVVLKPEDDSSEDWEEIDLST